MKDTILVLGCGPAGLLVAHACRLAGHNTQIISRKQPSYISGAQFLHTAIPGLTPDEPDGQIMFHKIGTKEGYAKKIYGDPGAPCSWDSYESGTRGIWNLSKWYQALWRVFDNNITNGEMSADLLPLAFSEFKAVFSTIPLTQLFPNGRYRTETVIIDDEALAVPDSIIYNGLMTDDWYRASSIFGHSFVEYPNDLPAEKKINLTLDARWIKKPLYSNVSPPKQPLFLFGRYGTWRKGVLVDDAFRDAYDIAKILK